jgi:hypothetical protein
VEYGKIDYVIDEDGAPVLFDVNKTIGVNDPNSDLTRSQAEIIASGLEFYLR